MRDCVVSLSHTTSLIWWCHADWSCGKRGVMHKWVGHYSTAFIAALKHSQLLINTNQSLLMHACIKVKVSCLSISPGLPSIANITKSDKLHEITFNMFTQTIPSFCSKKGFTVSWDTSFCSRVGYHSSLWYHEVLENTLHAFSLHSN